MILFLFCCFLFSLGVEAQSRASEWQIRTGLVGAQIVSPTGGASKLLYKYSLGVFSTYQANKKNWSWFTGLELISKGMGANKHIQPQYQERLNLQYINCTIGSKYAYKKVHFIGGFFLGYLASAENSLPSSLRFFEPKKIKKIDLGVNIGVGVRFFDFLDLDLVYGPSLNNMYRAKIYGANLSSAYEYYRHRTLSLCTGVALKF